jgi:hypothetical protein
MNMIAQLIAWLNAATNAVFGPLRGPMQALPAWLSLALMSALLGVLMLVLFKYTSPQRAIGRVRDRIKANLLAMKLFKDSVSAVLKAQGRVFAAAFMLLVCSLPPVLVMILPFCLVLGQLGTWYECRPLKLNEKAVIEMQLSGTENDPLPPVALEQDGVVRIVAGPVRVPSEQRVYWKIEALQPGAHELRFAVGEGQVGKRLTVGSGLMPVSMKRPGMHIGDLILYPAEKPFAPESPVQSIAISYPKSNGVLAGSGNWVITLFIVSMLCALAVKDAFRVKL